MRKVKLDVDQLTVESFSVPTAPDLPRYYIEPDYSARHTCPDGDCAPYTNGGLYQQTCEACTFTCWAC
jgi:hypothetical protein